MDKYWSDILAAYQDTSPHLSPRERWVLAYAHMREQQDIYSPVLPETEDQFIKQYAQAVGFMMVARTTHLNLPADFMARWAKVKR